MSCLHCVYYTLRSVNIELCSMFSTVFIFDKNTKTLYLSIKYAPFVNFYAFFPKLKKLFCKCICFFRMCVANSSISTLWIQFHITCRNNPGKGKMKQPNDPWNALGCQWMLNEYVYLWYVLKLIVNM